MAAPDLQQQGLGRIKRVLQPERELIAIGEALF